VATGKGPLPGMVVGGHAAADARGDRGKVLQVVSGTLPHGFGAGRGRPGGGAQALGGAGLLFPGEEPSEGCQAGGRGGRLPARRQGPEEASGRGGIHRGRDSLHRLRPPGTGHRRKPDPGAQPGVRRPGERGVARGQARAARGGAREYPPGAAGRFQSGDDGAGRADLHAPARLRCLPGAGRM